jgi:hypothetical protein
VFAMFVSFQRIEIRRYNIGHPYGIYSCYVLEP